MEKNYFAIDTDIYENEELKHFGILGMHWGIRRYQNPDGTLTPEGRERYGVKTVAETQRETYSKKLAVLENKKDRTEKEQKEYLSLRNGKRFCERWAGVYLDEETLKQYRSEYSENWKDVNKWINSTNFGNRNTSASWLFGIAGTLFTTAKHEPLYEKELLEASGRTNNKKWDKKNFENIMWADSQRMAENLLKNKKNSDDYEDLLYDLTKQISDYAYTEYEKEYKKQHSVGYKSNGKEKTGLEKLKFDYDPKRNTIKSK